MNIVQTELNERLAKSVRSRISAERFYIFGKIAFWWLVGVGLICFGIGSSVGFGFYGYSHILKHTGELNALAAVLSQSLSKIHLRATAEGTVQLEPHQVAFAEGQTVSLEHDTRVGIDRSSTITANGEIKIELPSVSTPPVNGTHAASSKLPLITNFTVFKSVPFGKGTVMTGWVFLSSAQTSPTHQYCYYTASLETPGFDISIDIGDDGELDTPKTLPNGFDINAAFDRCTWYRSR
jgi:hypothetical protein